MNNNIDTKSQNFFNSQYLPLLLFVFALFIRLSVMALAIHDEHNFFKPDSFDYVQLADNLIASNIYGTKEQPEIFRAPGYPFFLAVVFSVCGKNIYSTIFFQIILSSFTVLLLWFSLKNLFPDAHQKKLFYAVIFQVISIPAIISANLLLSESIFTFFLLLTVYLFTHLLKNKKNITFQQIILLSASTISLYFIRAIALPFIPLFFIVLLLSTRKTKHALLYLLLCLIPLSLWSYRNYRQAHYKGFSSVGAINIYRYYASALEANRTNKPYFKVISKFTATLSEYPTQTKQAEFAKKEGLSIIFKKPIKYAFIHLKSNTSTMLPAIGDLYQLFGIKIGGSGTLGIIQTQGIIAGVKHYFAGKWSLLFLSIPFIIILLSKYLLTALGVGVFSIKSIKAIRYKKFRVDANIILPLFFLCLITYLLLIPGPVSTPRFRVPVSPLLCIFIAYCLVNVKTLFWKK